MAVLEQLTTTSSADAIEGDPIGLLPVGSTEQHGPALPLGTDLFAAHSAARALAGREDVIVLPTIPIGIADFHRQFDGTLYVSRDTFEEYMYEILTSAAEHGLRKIVIVNAHGGNKAALADVARRLRREETVIAARWTVWDSCGELQKQLFTSDKVVHGGATESSMMLHVAREHVLEDELEAAEAGAADHERWRSEAHGPTHVPNVDYGFETRDLTETGTSGFPTDASEDAGEQLFNKVVSDLEDLVDWLLDQPFEDLLSRGHK